MSYGNARICHIEHLFIQIENHINSSFFIIQFLQLDFITTKLSETLIMLISAQTVIVKTNNNKDNKMNDKINTTKTRNFTCLNGGFYSCPKTLQNYNTTMKSKIKHLALRHGYINQMIIIIKIYTKLKTL